MKPFIAPTENFIKSEKTFISTPVAVGATIIYVDNNNGFEIDDYVIVSFEGRELAEIRKITSTPTGQTVVDALLFEHKVDEPIVKIAFNQRKFYGCATEDGTYILIETKNIEVDNPQGTYFSYSGSTYNWFKVTYYNETTTEETDIDDAIAVQSTETSQYCSVYDIREEAGFVNNPYISDGIIEAKRISAEAEVKASVGAVYTLPLSAKCELVGTITKLLAAGWLMWKEYGEEASGTDKDGMAKVKEARSMLKAIREKNLVLLDGDDAELTIVATDLGGYPDSTTADKSESDAGGKIHFRIKKQF